MNVNFKGNESEVISALVKAKQRGLEAIGITLERHAKEDPIMPVLTGRARNSITWATKKQEGKLFSYYDNKGNEYQDKVGKGAEKDAVYIGSNVEYFPVIENGGKNRPGKHVLYRAITGHDEECKNLLKESMENA